MYSIVDFIIKGIQGIISVLNVKMFSDFPITYLQLMCSVVVISTLYKFVFGGLREFDSVNNGFLFDSVGNVSKKISNDRREKQINNEIINGSINGYTPRHREKGYIGKHEKGYRANNNIYSPKHETTGVINSYRGKHERSVNRK